MGSKRRRSFAPSSYSPLDADAADAPELPRVERAWRDAARSLVRRLHLGLSRRWRPATPGTTLRPSTHAAGQPADRRGGAVAALAAPPAAGAAIRAADRRQPLDERPRTDRAADGGRDGERHDAGRGVHVLDGAPARDRRRAARGGGGDAPPRSPASCVGGRHQHRRVPARVPAAVRRAHGGTRHRRDDRERRARRRRAGHAARRDARAAPAVGRRGVAESAPRDGGYEPTASGMRAARPYVTTFTSVNDAAGLARLSRLVRIRA